MSNFLRKKKKKFIRKKKVMPTDLRPNKKICLVPVTCPKKVGRVGREFFLFYLFFY